MAVAVSATGTAVYKTSATTQTFTTFTVNASDTLAVFWIMQDATQTISSVHWDSTGTNQTCTLITSEACTTASSGKVYLYAVVNPTSGTHTLSVVNAVATGTAAQLQSYTGTDTSGSVATVCTNALVANGNASPMATAAQTGVAGNMFIAGYTTPGVISSVNNTTVFNLSPAGNDSAGNRALSTGASVTLSSALSSGALWAAVSCNIVATTGVVALPFGQSSSGKVKDIGGSFFEAPYNMALLAPIAPIVLPFNQTDWSKPINIVGSFADMPYNMALLTPISTTLMMGQAWL